MPDLLIVVPSRGRPHHVARVVEAWQATGAYDDGAELMFAVDRDDPAYDTYIAEIGRACPGTLGTYRAATWQPMVAKLNAAAVQVLAGVPGLPALGFAGDDHAPRSRGWAGRYIETLRQLGTGIVYGDDGHRGEQLPTQWAMTADIVRELGAMVPAPVEHQFCDRAILDLGQAAGCLRYLPDVLIEHLHYSVGKSVKDPGYERVNSMEQWRADEQVWLEWRANDLDRQAAAVRALRGGGRAGG